LESPGTLKDATLVWPLILWG